MGRILVIANKFFEAEPLMAVLANADARPAAIGDLGRVVWPRLSPKRPEDVIAEPRAHFALGAINIEIWCIQDLMSPDVPGGSSNTAEKARVLRGIFDYEGCQVPPKCVVAFGTASMIGNDTYNGSVTLGTRVFLHNPYATSPASSPSAWTSPNLMDCVVPSSFPASSFDEMSPFTAPMIDIHHRLLRPFGQPAADCMLLCDRNGVAISSVNVVDHQQYDRTDPEAIIAAQIERASPLISLESTHGVIRAQSDAPFLFISGITNRVGHFADENAAFPYTQNFVAAHNASIALAWLLPWIVRATTR